MRVWLCFEVQVLGVSFALAVLIELAVCAGVLLRRVPRLLLPLVCFGAPAAGDAVRVEAVSQRQRAAVGVTQRVAAVAGAQDVTVHRAGATVVIDIRVRALLRGELVLRV